MRRYHRRHILYGVALAPLCNPGRVAAGPLSWPAQRLRLRGIARDEPSGYDTLYCRRYLLLVEPACYEGRGHGAA
jgi:hypothetical protein